MTPVGIKIKSGISLKAGTSFLACHDMRVQSLRTSIFLAVQMAWPHWIWPAVVWMSMTHFTMSMFLVIAPIFLFICYNPMAFQLLNYLSASAIKYYRICMIRIVMYMYVVWCALFWTCLYRQTEMILLRWYVPWGHYKTQKAVIRSHTVERWTSYIVWC